MCISCLCSSNMNLHWQAELGLISARNKQYAEILHCINTHVIGTKIYLFHCTTTDRAYCWKLYQLIFYLFIYFLLMKFIQCTGNEPNNS